MGSRARTLKEGLARAARVAGWLYSPIPVGLGGVLGPNYPITDRGLERRPGGATWSAVVSALRGGAARAIAGMRELAEQGQEPRSVAGDLRLLVGRVSDPRAAAHLPRLGAILVAETFSGVLADLREVGRGEPPPTAGSFSSAFEGRTPEGERVGVLVTYRVEPASDGKYELYIDTLRLLWGGVPRGAPTPSQAPPSYGREQGYRRPLGGLGEVCWRSPAPRGDPRALARGLLADLDLLYEDVRLGRLEERQVADALRSAAERGRELVEAAAALAGRLTPYAAERLMEEAWSASEALERLEELARGGADRRRLPSAVADARRAVSRLLDRLPALPAAAALRREEERLLIRPEPPPAAGEGAPAAQWAREPPVAVEEHVVSPERGVAEQLEGVLKEIEGLYKRVWRGERSEEVARSAGLLAERLEGLLGRLGERAGKPARRALESLRLLAERGSQLVYTQVLMLLIDAGSGLREALGELARPSGSPARQ